MIFSSDNWAGAAPQVSDALSKAAGGFHPAYGTGEMDLQFKDKLAELFDHEVEVYTVSTGTAANSLALSLTQKPGAQVFCHCDSHIVEDECNAPDFFMSGGRMLGISGDMGLIDTNKLKAEIARYSPDNVHHGQPSALSITQATEFGTLYTLDQIEEMGQIAQSANLPLHMDGARFANALVALDTTPAEMTWKRGVDMLSFGGTKNGCWCAEAVVIFKRELAQQLPFYHKRAAQLFSKNRFVSAQFNAYLEDGLWLELAKHANGQAAKLSAAFNELAGIELAWPTKANMVFAIMEEKLAEKLWAAGAHFYQFPTPHSHREILPDKSGIYRFVTSFATSDEDLDSFIKLLG